MRKIKLKYIWLSAVLLILECDVDSEVKAEEINVSAKSSILICETQAMLCGVKMNTSLYL